MVAWQVAFHAPDGRLHLALLDVGKGDALLIQTPGGRSVLVDGGSSPVKLSQGLGRRLPLTRRRLDWLVVGAPGTEHVLALPRLLERFPAENVLWAGESKGNAAARNLQEYLTWGWDRAVVMALTGQALDLGDGAMLRVLHAGESGAVLLLEWRNFRALLPVGMDDATLERMLDDPALTPVTALLLAEGGAAALNPPEWIEKLRPQVVLLSAAADELAPDPEAGGFRLSRIAAMVSWPVFTSYTRVASPPTISCLPSELKTISTTTPTWLGRVRTSAPVRHIPDFDYSTSARGGQ